MTDTKRGMPLPPPKAEVGNIIVIVANNIQEVNVLTELIKDGITIDFCGTLPEAVERYGSKGLREVLENKDICAAQVIYQSMDLLDQLRKKLHNDEKNVIIYRLKDRDGVGIPEYISFRSSALYVISNDGTACLRRTKLESLMFLGSPNIHMEPPKGWEWYPGFITTNTISRFPYSDNVNRHLRPHNVIAFDQNQVQDILRLDSDTKRWMVKAEYAQRLLNTVASLECGAYHDIPIPLFKSDLDVQCFLDPSIVTTEMRRVALIEQLTETTAKSNQGDWEFSRDSWNVSVATDPENDMGTYLDICVYQPTDDNEEIDVNDLTGEHIALCKPTNIRLLLDYIQELEDKLDDIGANNQSKRF